MIRKLVLVLAIALVLGIKARGQEAPAGQPPAAGQQPAAGQENPEEEASSRRKAHPIEYRKWTFNLGGGANLANGTTATFVRGGGAVAEAGAARNYSKYFGLHLDFLWANLPLRASALELAQAASGTDYVYGLMLDPIINVPITKKYTGYFLVGPGFYHRAGTLDSSTVVPGSPCNAFWDWWGRCFNGSVPLHSNFLRESQNELGFNFGGGVTRKVSEHIEVYGEFRYVHGSHNNIPTVFRPLSFGVRW
jgi:opacity protein-like surface antigen